MRQIHRTILDFVRRQPDQYWNGPICIEGFGEIELLAATIQLKRLGHLAGEFAPNPNYPEGKEWGYVFIRRKP